MKEITNLNRVEIDFRKLKELRGEVQQTEIGEKIGVSDRQISNIEQGIRNPSAKGLLRLMLLYKINPEDIAIIR